jgi:Right handed beta helix region
MPTPLRFLAALLTCCLGVVMRPPLAAAEIAPPWPPARGVEVPAGCESPKTSPTRHIFYIDPVNGAASGDGSESRPWNSLSDIVKKGLVSSKPYDPNSPAVKAGKPAWVFPGDVIRLKSGDYGNIEIQGYYSALVAFDNTDFITIEAAPGATPMLGSLTVVGAGKWIFRGLTIENIAPNLARHAYGSLVAFSTPHHDIIFDGNTVRSSSDISAWSQADWLAKAADGIFDYGGAYNGASCVTITNNKLINVGNGMRLQRSDKVLVKGNTIDYFTHDGIDYGSNNMTIQNNIETNHIDAGDIAKVHPDFMQGQAYGCNAAGQNCDTLSNLVIDGNIAIRQTDPNMPFAKISVVEGAIQGIDTFDGIWNNVKITNNIVITSTYHGIAYYGVHGAVIANNVVLSDGNSKKLIPWITVQNQKNKTVSSDVVIRNNITSGLNYARETTNISVDHNLCTNMSNRCDLSLVFGGKPYRFGVPGTYGDDNVIDLNGPSDLFKKFLAVDGTVTEFDLRLKPGTRAVGTGNAEAAPATDITGAERTVPYDLGAYKSVTSAPTATTDKSKP